MTSESSPVAFILTGDDGRLYRFPADALAHWRQPAGAAATGTDDPTYTSPDGTCYVIPRAEVAGYGLGQEETAAIRSQLEQGAGAETTGYAGTTTFGATGNLCGPGYLAFVLHGGADSGVINCMPQATFGQWTATSSNTVQLPSRVLSHFR